MNRSLHLLLAACLTTLPAVSVSFAGSTEGPLLTQIRFFPGPTSDMKGGKFTGSNTSPTNDFDVLATIEAPVVLGEWNEIEVKPDMIYRWLKFEGAPNSYGQIAEIEFYSGETKLSGEPFGTQGARNDGDTTFEKATDGDPQTWFEGPNHSGQYAGIDLGEAVQTKAPVFSSASGDRDDSIELEIASDSPGATIRYAIDSGLLLRPTDGTEYIAPLRINQNSVVIARAFAPGFAPSPVTIQAFRVGEGVAEDVVTTFLIGNSLTDTIVFGLPPVASAAGKNLQLLRFTIPGAPTDWLWNNPGTGFGLTHYLQGFESMAPIDHITVQPFSGHARSIENETEYGLRFFEAARRHSPEIQPWLYVQWPPRSLDDSWSQAKSEDAKALGLAPVTLWEHAIENHIRYIEAIRDEMNKTWTGKPVRVIPGALALNELRKMIAAGEASAFPAGGEETFLNAAYRDGGHLNPIGAYTVSLAVYASFFGESPEGKVPALDSGLTDSEATILQGRVWRALQDYAKEQ
ncbi:MAG: chitobiase/beta-hexosaminidase C-terminal domain-containing protein [Verrucomicrobiia bacterium]